MSSAKSERRRSRYLLALEEVGIQTPLSQVQCRHVCNTKLINVRSRLWGFQSTQFRPKNSAYMPYGHLPYSPLPYGHLPYKIRPFYALWPPIYALWPYTCPLAPLYAFRPLIYALRPPIYALRPPIYALWPLICLSATYLCLSATYVCRVHNLLITYEIGGLKIRPNRCTYLPVTSGLSQAITGLSDNIGGLKIRPICRTSYFSAKICVDLFCICINVSSITYCLLVDLGLEGRWGGKTDQPAACD